MNITAHLCVIYAILAMMAGTMFFDSIYSTHLHTKQITLIKKDMLQDFIQFFESRFSLDDKIDALRNDVFADVMKEIKTMSLFKDKAETSKKTKTEWIDDTNDEMMEDRFLSTSHHMKSNKNEDKQISKKKNKMNLNRDFAFDSKKSGEWMRSSAKSNLKQKKELFLTEQSEDYKRQHNVDVDVRLEIPSKQWQKSITSDFHHRNLEESFPDCNETLFHFEIEFHPDVQKETSWDLVDTATNTTIVEKKIANITEKQKQTETQCLRAGSYKITLYDSDEDGWVCVPFSLNPQDPCYRIFVDHQMIVEGFAFGDQISHTFDSTALCLTGSLFLLESNLDLNDPNIKMLLQDDISGQAFNLSNAPVQNNDYTYFYYTCITPPAFYSFSIETIEQNNISCDEFDGCYRISINDKIILEMNDVFEKSVHKIRISETGDGEEFICNGTIFTLDLVLDWYPEETSWELRDEKENTIVANASYEDAKQFEFVHEEICVEPGPYSFTLDDSRGNGIDCELSSCYNIYINNEKLVQGSKFKKNIFHPFVTGSSLCVIDSTFLLELRLEHNNTDFHPYLVNEVTDDTVNLIETPIQNDNYTNSFYACLVPGVYVMDIMNEFDFPTSNCGSSACFQVSVNNEVFANSNDFLSLVEFRFSLSNNFIARQPYCHRSPFLSVDNFAWNDRKRHTMSVIKSLSSHEALTNIYAPQYKAACWLLYDDSMETPLEDESTLERYALGVFLYSTNQYAEMMRSGNSCAWDFIWCDDMGHVVEIWLDSRGISGTIPSEISYLRFLEVLSLDRNQIEGTLPSELGRLLHLKELKLEVNSVTGTIPTEIGKLSNFKVLRIDGNVFLNGGIPSELGQCSKLEELWLQGNNLSGTIPSELFNLRLMRLLYLYSNQLTGSIPSNIRQLEQLVHLYLYNNHLVGTIPNGIGELSTLIDLQFQDNGLTGTVPSSFGNIQNLFGFTLHNNKLSGSLPDMFDAMSRLWRLNFSNNTLSGSLPDSLGKLSSVGEVFLNNNEFTGSIPPSFCSLNEPKVNIRNTKINGTVPDECCGSLDIKKDMGWFEELILECSCCDDGAECFVWSIDDVVKEVKNDPPCPTKNVYEFEFKWQYWVTDKILDAQIWKGNAFAWEHEQVCLSPTGCYELTNRINPTYFLNYDASSLSLLIQEEEEFDQCNTIHLCDTSFNSTHPHRPKLNHITQLAVPDMTTLDHPNLPYHDALCWIMTKDDFLDAYDICDGTLLQRYVMALFYISQNITFSFDVFSNSTTCNWPGITCDSSNTFIQNLTFSNLTGTLITEIGLLQSLEVLNLSSSNLTGSLITEIGHLVNLQTLDLSNNALDGSIGSSIFTNTPKLSSFNISNNTIEGQIPKEMFEHRNLRQIILANNALVNTLPVDKIYSDSIEYFNVQNNLLQGSIPDAMFDCKNLMHIDLSRNGFTGAIPANIGDFNKLQFIHLSENKLSGSIPVDLFEHIHIRELLLHSNRFTGSIPTQVGNLPNATDIALNHNSLKGTIPTELTKLPNIRLLHLHSSKLTGTAPNIILSINTNTSTNTSLSFITDCGNPSYLIGTAVTCDSCTMCCNSDGQCQVKDPFAMAIWKSAVLTALGPSILILIFGYILWKSNRQLFSKLTLHDRDVDTAYSNDSVYCFILSNNKVAWFIHFATAIIQVVLFGIYLSSSNALRKDTDFVYTYRCPDNDLECDDLSSVTTAGWILLCIVLVLHLGRDFAMSCAQLMIFIKTLDYHLLVSGLSIFILTGVAMSTSIIYNMALAAKNTDLLTNAVILLFINDLDEKCFEMLQFVRPCWVKAVLEEIDSHMTMMQNNVDTMEESESLK